jgi:hypothetical protein
VTLLVGLLDGIDEHVGGALAHLEGGNEEGCGARAQAAGVGGVGAREDGDVAGDAELARLHVVVHVDEQGVVGGEDRAGAVLATGEPAVEDGEGLGLVVVAAADVLVLELEPGIAHGAAQAVQKMDMGGRGGPES